MSKSSKRRKKTKKSIGNNKSNNITSIPGTVVQPSKRTWYSNFLNSIKNLPKKSKIVGGSTIVFLIIAILTYFQIFPSQSGEEKELRKLTEMGAENLNLKLKSDFYLIKNRLFTIRKYIPLSSDPKKVLQNYTLDEADNFLKSVKREIEGELENTYLLQNDSLDKLWRQENDRIFSLLNTNFAPIDVYLSETTRRVSKEDSSLYEGVIKGMYSAWVNNFFRSFYHKSYAILTQEKRF